MPTRRCRRSPLRHSRSRRRRTRVPWKNRATAGCSSDRSAPPADPREGLRQADRRSRQAMTRGSERRPKNPGAALNVGWPIGDKLSVGASFLPIEAVSGASAHPPQRPYSLTRPVVPPDGSFVWGVLSCSPSVERRWPNGAMDKIKVFHRISRSRLTDSSALRRRPSFSNGLVYDSRTRRGTWPPHCGALVQAGRATAGIPH